MKHTGTQPHKNSNSRVRFPQVKVTLKNSLVWEVNISLTNKLYVIGHRDYFSISQKLEFYV